MVQGENTTAVEVAVAHTTHLARQRPRGARVVEETAANRAAKMPARVVGVSGCVQHMPTSHLGSEVMPKDSQFPRIDLT